MGRLRVLLSSTRDPSAREQCRQGPVGCTWGGLWFLFLRAGLPPPFVGVSLGYPRDLFSYLFLACLGRTIGPNNIGRTMGSKSLGRTMGPTSLGRTPRGTGHRNELREQHGRGARHTPYAGFTYMYIKTYVCVGVEVCTDLIRKMLTPSARAGRFSLKNRLAALLGRPLDP